MARGGWALLVLAALVAGCSASPSASGPTAARSSPTPATSSPGPVAVDEPPVRASSTLACGNSIDGGPPPPGFTVVLGAVALPAAPGYAALQAFATGSDPGSGLFAKTGLLVRAGAASQLDVPASVEPSAGIGWGGGPSVPGRTFVVPACPDARGTGWLAFPGGYWAARPLCLPLDVSAGGQQQRVRIGIGTPCPGQSAPAG